jgi:hypothetical protein
MPLETGIIPPDTTLYPLFFEMPKAEVKREHPELDNRIKAC